MLFEHFDKLDFVSCSRFTPEQTRADSTIRYNAGQKSDICYSFDVIVNGPLLSPMRANTFNWLTNEGFYELTQTYTAYYHQKYTTFQIEFTEFYPTNPATKMGVSIRKHPTEEVFHQQGNVVLTGGKEEIVSPGDQEDLNTLPVDFTVHALAVPPEYKPEFQFIEDYQENYSFKIVPP